MSARPDYYRILHVQEDAPFEVIRSSYRTIMRTLGAHPDLGGDGAGARAINEAWSVLSDPTSRARYDAELALVAAHERLSAAAETEPIAPPSAGADEPRDDRGERRAIPRLERTARIRWVAPDGAVRSSRSRDLSPRGLSFTTSVALEAGTEIEIESDALSARAVVRNVRPVGGGDLLIGVEFLSVRFRDSRGTFVSRSA